MRYLKKIQFNSKLFKLIAINLALTFIGLEIISLLFYGLQEKKFFYISEKPQQKIIEEIAITGLNLDASIVGQLHPFLGYVLKANAMPFNKDLGIKVNNYGIYAQHDYPFIRNNNNQYIIGIFGGSVAQGIAVHELATKTIFNKLKTLPEFTNKEIIVLDFAVPGTKQPQQLLMLNYFLSIGQEFDMVINIDGFNEIALSYMNNQEKVDLAMPNVGLTLPLINMANNALSIKQMKSIVKINQTKEDLKTSIKNLENCKLALCYEITSLQIKNLVNYYQRETNKLNKTRENIDNKSTNDVIYYNRLNEVLPEAIALEKIVANWYKSSLTMQQILSSKNIKYFHFIQPNQYYPTQRIFSEAEKKIAIHPNAPYTEAILKGYPLLLSKISDLRKSNVNIFSAVNIFDNVKDIIYVDNCCHYNNQGQQLLSEYISQTIAENFTKTSVNNSQSNNLTSPNTP